MEWSTPGERSGQLDADAGESLIDEDYALSKKGFRQTEREVGGKGEEKKWKEMNDEALHYAMIGGRPKEKQQGIE